MNAFNIEETKKSALIVTTASSFLTPLALATVPVALPTIGKAFNVDVMVLSWIATSYILSAAVFLVPFGKIADMYGRKRIFLIGMIIFTLASFILGVSNSTTMLIVLRVFQGTGGAMIFGTAIAILSSVFPPGERGRVLGINVAGVYLGLSIGPFLGGVLTQHIGWRSIFLFNCPLGVFVILLTIIKLRGEWADAKKDRFDFIGSFFYSIMLLCLMYGFSKLQMQTGKILILAGIAGMGVFVLWERRARNPIIDMQLFLSNKVFTMSNIAALLNYSATFAIGFLLSFYLQHIKNFSPQTTGVVLVAQPIMQAILSPLAGKVSDRIEPRIVASSGMAVTALGLFLLSFINGSTHIIYIVVSLIILGSGFALFASPNTNAIMSSVENRYYGIASSMLATMRLLGQLFSMGIAMLIFALYMGHVEISPQYHFQLLSGIKTAFVVFGLLCVCGIFISLTRGNLRDNKNH
ncbi:MAG TPA: MFS transporter [Syntrophorhabdaceae bacterium]|nr:MFS transporter [Syntrophorhabdaceae bacterium]HPP05902.1 MFS transporter [Syntrophorhabdaceae bacterium]